MAAANDAQKKTTIDDTNVIRVGGDDVHVDNDGHVVKVVKSKDKAKKFKSATQNMTSQMEDSQAANEVDIAKILQQQKDR